MKFKKIIKLMKANKIKKKINFVKLMLKKISHNNNKKKNHHNHNHLNKIHRKVLKNKKNI